MIRVTTHFEFPETQREGSATHDVTLVEPSVESKYLLSFKNIARADIRTSSIGTSNTASTSREGTCSTASTNKASTAWDQKTHVDSTSSIGTSSTVSANKVSTASDQQTHVDSTYSISTSSTVTTNKASTASDQQSTRPIRDEADCLQIGSPRPGGRPPVDASPIDITFAPPRKSPELPRSISRARQFCREAFADCGLDNLGDEVADLTNDLENLRASYSALKAQHGLDAMLRSATLPRAVLADFTWEARHAPLN